jgi:signal transduction histidine kinase
VLGTGRVAVIFGALNVVLYSLMSLAQWAGWGGWYTAAHTSVPHALGEASAVTLVNLAFGLLVLAGVFALHPMRWPSRSRYPLVALVALIGSVPRVLAMQAIHSTPSGLVYVVVEWLAGLAAGFVAVAAGMLTAQLVGAARSAEADRLREAQRAARAVEELQTEELRVRRMVADQLHGSLQHRLVTVTAGLDAVCAQLDAGGSHAAAGDLRRWAETLEEIREEEVRSLSHAVFPSGVEQSTIRALEIMMRRLPPQIATSVEIGPTYRRLVDQSGALMPMAERLVAVYTVEEGITNALKHGRARSLHLRADVRPTDDPGLWVLDVVVDDDGTGIGEGRPELRGLSRHSERLVARGGSLELGARPEGGARLSFTLPFRRVGAASVAAPGSAA